MAPGTVHHFFVDEAGDLTLFDRRKRLVLGQEGVSHTFIVGAALVEDPSGVSARLEALRARLAADPLLAGAPSMKPDAGRTAVAFHANKDLPEVRMEVFRQLMQERVRVFAAVRRKHALVHELQRARRAGHAKRDLEQVYDALTALVFKDRLHLADENRIVFARRGQADKSAALRDAIAAAKRRFERRWQKGIDRPTHVASAYPREHVGLQVVDYFLWALQRLIERGESRFFEAVRPSFALIVDVDDTRRYPYGEYYHSRNPLSPERVMPVIAARSE